MRALWLVAVISTCACNGERASSRRAQAAEPTTSGSAAPSSASSTGTLASTPPPPAASVASLEEKAPPKGETGVGRCRIQQPLPFLLRKAYVPLESHSEEHRKAIEFRTRQYGYVPGFGEPSWNPHPPEFYVEIAKFHGLRFRINKKIVPALKCAELEIARSCPEKYQFWDMTGIRFKNTYCCGEISNHMYGIAVDIDPSNNTCCNCAPPWNENPRCKKKTSSIWERMVMPECWVKAFEKYGWHWLGREEIEDTMHFEFLGDPDHIEE